jgi:hypothetical protein
MPKLEARVVKEWEVHLEPSEVFERETGLSTIHGIVFKFWLLIPTVI